MMFYFSSILKRKGVTQQKSNVLTISKLVASCFETKSSWLLCWIIGIQFTRIKQNLFLSKSIFCCLMANFVSAAKYSSKHIRMKCAKFCNLSLILDLSSKNMKPLLKMGTKKYPIIQSSFILLPRCRCRNNGAQIWRMTVIWICYYL